MAATASGTYYNGVTLNSISENPLTIATTGVVLTTDVRAAVYGEKGVAWTVINKGLVFGNENLAFKYYGVGIGLGSGGTVTNMAGAYLHGYGTGVQMYSGGGMVTNAGTIKGGPRHALHWRGAGIGQLCIQGRLYRGRRWGHRQFRLYLWAGRKDWLRRRPHSRRQRDQSGGRHHQGCCRFIGGLDCRCRYRRRCRNRRQFRYPPWRHRHRSEGGRQRDQHGGRGNRRGRRRRLHRQCRRHGGEFRHHRSDRNLSPRHGDASCKGGCRDPADGRQRRQFRGGRGPWQ